MNLNVINTGSSGNAYCLSHGTDMLLLDAGVPENAILKSVDFNLKDIDCVLVSHAHTDHFRSAEYLLNCFVNVMMSQESADSLKINTFRPTLHIADEQQHTFGNWIVKSFKLEHDVDNIGYLVYHKETKQRICYVTDSGFIRALPKDINILIIECNHIASMLDKEEMEERYSRVRESHMSLERLESYLKKIDRTKLTHIVLVHLSDTNSDEQMIVRSIRNLTGVNVTAARNGLDINLDEVPF